MASSPHSFEATNPFQRTGIAPELIKAVNEVGGAEGLRSLVSGVHRATAKILHPDTAGDDSHQAGLEFLDGQTRAANMLKGADDTTVRTFAKAYALSRPGKSRATRSNNGRELVSAEYVHTGQIIRDLVTMALETQLSMPSALGKHIWLRPSAPMPGEPSAIRRLDASPPTTFKMAEYDSLTSELDNLRLSPAKKLAATRTIMQRKAHSLNAFLASHSEPTTFMAGRGTWLQLALNEKNLTDSLAPELFMSIGDSAVSFADYHDGSFICSLNLPQTDTFRQEFPNGHYTTTRGSFTRDSTGKPLRFGIHESFLRLEDTAPITIGSVVIGSVRPEFIKGELPNYSASGGRMVPLTAALGRRDTTIPAIPIPESRYTRLGAHFTPLVTAGNDLVGVNPEGAVQLLGNITGIEVYPR